MAFTPDNSVKCSWDEGQSNLSPKNKKHEWIWMETDLESKTLHIESTVSTF